MKIPEPKKCAGGYKIRLRVGGDDRHVYGATAKECRNNAAELKLAYLTGKMQISSVGDKTLGDLIDEYCAQKSNVLSPATLRGYGIIRRNRFPEIMNTPISHVKAFQSAINAEAGRVSPKTVVSAWGLVKAVMRQNGIDPGNVTLPQVVQKDEPWLDPEEIKVFVRAIEGKDFEFAALLGLHSLRRSEIMAVAVTPGCIDVKNKMIHVRGAVVPNEDHQFVLKNTNKNRTSRRDIPFMIPRLAELAESGTPVLVESQSTLLRRINKLCVENDLPEIGVHGLRRSFASLAYHLGWPERYTMRIGGWADAQTMHKIYIKLSAADEAKHVQSMSDFFCDNPVPKLCQNDS